MTAPTITATAPGGEAGAVAGQLALEEWRSVIGYEGLYEVSSLGRVRSLDRMTTGSSRYAVKGKLLKLSIKPGTGYLSVGLTRDGRTKTWNVHRLVGDAFIGPRPEGLVTCHADGDKTNNRAENLRYDTYGANLRDSVKHGTHVMAGRTRCPKGHEYTDANTRVTRDRKGLHRRCRECERIYRARKRADVFATRELRAA